MLTLTLLRHAKSSWEDMNLRDIERPLNKRGKRQAALMGTQLERLGLRPELILCSPAKRTRQTLKRVLKNGSITPEILFPAKLYLASPARILKLLAKCGDGYSHIMVIGHNPGLHMLASELAQKGQRNQLETLEEHYPTSALSVIEVKGRNWRKLPGKEGELVTFITPRQVEAKQEQAA